MTINFKYIRKVTLDAGTRVLIRDDLEPLKQYGDDVFANGMCEYMGMHATITAKPEKNRRVFKLDIDEERWNWTREMFQKTQ